MIPTKKPPMIGRLLDVAVGAAAHFIRRTLLLRLLLFIGALRPNGSLTFSYMGGARSSAS